MPWLWVAVGFVLWTCAALVVIALCVSVRQMEARSGRDRDGVRYAGETEARPGPEAKLE